MSSLNLVVLSGVVKSMALRFDATAKPELRFTLQQTDHGADGKPWTSYWPCCASGTTAERLAGELEDGQHIVITSGKLCYRKRSTKAGEQSRMEILVWQVDRLDPTTAAPHEPAPAYTTGAEVTSGPAPKGKPRDPKWRPEAATPTPPRG